METFFSALLALCAANSPVTGEIPSQRLVMRSFDFFFDLHLYKRLGKPSIRRWFEMPSHSLWRHCNDIAVLLWHVILSIMWIMCISDRLITVSDHVITVSECAILHNNIHHIFGRRFWLINRSMLHVTLKIRVAGDLRSSYCASNAVWKLFDVCRLGINISNDLTYILYSVV